MSREYRDLLVKDMPDEDDDAGEEKAVSFRGQRMSRAKMTAPKNPRKPRAARHRQGAVVGSVFDVYGGGR